jgi:predicted nucleic acid-binding protein
MRVVCDASIIVDAFTLEVDNPVFSTAAHLIGQINARQIEAHAPTFFLVECANALVKHQRRSSGLDKPKDAILCLDTLDKLPIWFTRKQHTASQVASWAFAMNCGAYDAVYIELARMLDSPVATSDRGMAAACKRFGVALWAPTA